MFNFRGLMGKPIPGTGGVTGDIVFNAAKRSSQRAAGLAMGAMSDSAGIRSSSRTAIRQGMSRLGMPAAYGAAGGAAIGMAYHAGNDMVHDRTPTLGGTLGAGFKGALAGGLAGGVGFGAYRLGRSNPGALMNSWAEETAGWSHALPLTATDIPGATRSGRRVSVGARSGASRTSRRQVGSFRGRFEGGV